MSDDGEETILICTRVKDGPEVPGYTARCLACAEVVTISPATFEMWTKTPAPKSIRCGPCWLKEVQDRTDKITIQVPTPAQLAELKAAIERRKQSLN